VPRYRQPVRKDRYGNPDVIDLIARHIKAVKREVRRPNRIGEGMAAGRGDNGGSLVVVGRLGNGRRGHQVNRLDGSTAFAAYDAPDGNGFVGIYDKAGQYIITDDARSGRGIARPYIPIAMGLIVPPLAGGPAITSSTDWVSLLRGNVPMQHPVLKGEVGVQTAAGVTAEYRLALDGVQIGDAVSVAPNTWGYLEVLAATAFAGPYTEFHIVTVDARITGGAGNAGAAPISLYGVESSWLGS
jgi:hypothetical protein